VREIVERETFDTSYVGGKSVKGSEGLVFVRTVRPACASSLLSVMHFSVRRSTSVSPAGQNPKRR
jgi:hypothetical protein